MSRFSKHNFLFIFVSLFVCTSVFWSLKNVGKLPQNHTFHENVTTRLPKIIIGLVSCRKKEDETSSIETSVLIKSVLISAQLYHVREIDFHIFLEHESDNQFFKNILKQYGFPNENTTVFMFFHSAVNIVPKTFWKTMIYHKTFRCGYSRLYFSKELDDLDAIVYMDTDFIVTGNIFDLWKHFEMMNDHQLIGVSPNNEPEALPVNYKTTGCLRDNVPFVHPVGLNSGLLLMNLTRMRKYNWEEKVSRTFKDYSKIAPVDDQVILNIILYYDPGLLYTLPCQFNVRCSPCNQALLCNNIRNDPNGIQSIHGASNQYKPEGRFYYIFKQYKEFDILKHDVVEDLMMPIRRTKEPRSKKGDQKCDPTINEYLFPNILKTYNEK